jgi:hypothetical protein
MQSHAHGNGRTDQSVGSFSHGTRDGFGAQGINSDDAGGAMLFGRTNGNQDRSGMLKGGFDVWPR